VWSHVTGRTWSHSIHSCSTLDFPPKVETYGDKIILRVSATAFNELLICPRIYFRPDIGRRRNFKSFFSWMCRAENSIVLPAVLMLNDPCTFDSPLFRQRSPQFTCYRIIRMRWQDGTPRLTHAVTQMPTRYGAHRQSIISAMSCMVCWPVALYSMQARLLLYANNETALFVKLNRNRPTVCCIG